MRTCHLWSCSSINITLTCCIMIIGFKNINWKCSIHHDWKGDLSINHPHTSYLVHLDTFVKHFIPHQFRVAMSSDYKTMVHGVRVMLDVHLKWVVLEVDVQNMFGLVSRIAIFQELWSCTSTLDQIFPFVHQFYTSPSPIYFLKASKHKDLIIISFKFGTQQKDPLEKMLFTLSHL